MHSARLSTDFESETKHVGVWSLSHTDAAVDRAPSFFVACRAKPYNHPPLMVVLEGAPSAPFLLCAPLPVPAVFRLPLPLDGGRSDQERAACLIFKTTALDPPDAPLLSLLLSSLEVTYGHRIRARGWQTWN